MPVPRPENGCHKCASSFLVGWGLMGNVGGSGGQELGSGMWDLESGSLGAGGMEMR